MVEKIVGKKMKRKVKIFILTNKRLIISQTKREEAGLEATYLKLNRRQEAVSSKRELFCLSESQHGTRSSFPPHPVACP